MIFFVLSRKMIFLFPENMISFFGHERKDDLSQKKKKYLEIWYFLRMFWKDGLSKKFVPGRDLFCNIWKDGISFFQKIWYFFFRRKMKEDDLYQRARGNMVFSVYMRRRYKYDIAFLGKKKQGCPYPQKIHLRVISPASTKKMMFILENMVFLLKYHIDWHPRKGPRSSYWRCSTGKGVLKNFIKFTGKDLCQRLLLIRLQA